MAATRSSPSTREGTAQSGGLVGIDGPREVADTRAVRDWLAARPDVSDTKIGAWGISYGGGAVFNSLVAGVPWAAVTTVADVDRPLHRAHAPGAREVGARRRPRSVDPGRSTRPRLAALTAAAFTGDASAVKPWTDARSSLAKLSSVTTPVLDGAGSQGLPLRDRTGHDGVRAVAGPKVLYVGLHGHTPSTFPAADTGFLMSQVRAWFDCYLRDTGCDGAAGVRLRGVGEIQRPGRRRGATCPRSRRRRSRFPASRRSPAAGRPSARRSGSVRRSRSSGAPTVQARRRERRLVAPRRRPDGAHAAGQGDRRRGRRRADRRRSAEGHDPPRKPGDLRSEAAHG